jgi:hypothetical protein
MRRELVTVNDLFRRVPTAALPVATDRPTTLTALHWCCW